MPVIYISAQTRKRLDTYKTRYVTEKHISQNVSHVISDDIIIQELMNTIEEHA